MEEGDIESTATQVVDEDISLLVGLARAETVGNGGGSGLVNDTENVKSSNGTGVFGGLTLVVVEVSWDSDDGLGDLLAELDLSDLLHLFSLLAKSLMSRYSGQTHLAEDHGGDLLGREGLGLAEVLDLNLGVVVVVNNLEWPRLDILLDGWVIESATDQTPVFR